MTLCKSLLISTVYRQMVKALALTLGLFLTSNCQGYYDEGYDCDYSGCPRGLECFDGTCLSEAEIDSLYDIDDNYNTDDEFSDPDENLDKFNSYVKRYG